jgi:RNA polymerase sigma factor (sigma-70 family)
MNLMCSGLERRYPMDRSQKSDIRSQNAKVRIAEARRRVLKGDVSAYEEIYAVCDGALRAFVGRRYGHLGDDFVREVVIRTLEYGFDHISEYDADKGASFQTWLNWHSRNVARKVRAERHDRNTVSLNEELDVQYVVTPSDPAEEHERQRRNRVLRQELKALAEQDRLSIAGHGSGRWTFSTTARRLGLTVPKARYRYESACRELKQRLELRGVRPTEVVPCYGRVGILPDDSGDEDDRAAMPMAFLPDGPDTLAGAAAADVEKEVPSD